MKWYGHPTLKFQTGDKLHISKEPGLSSWAALLSITSLGIATDYYVIPDNFLAHASFLLMCLILGLNFLERWEDFILDREENIATHIYRNWYHGFSMKVPEENVKSFPLNCITSVVISPESKISIILKDGSCVHVASDDKNCNRCLRKLRKEVATFLHLERVQNLKENDVLPDWDDYWWVSSENHDNDSDTESQESMDLHEHSDFNYARNLKIISGST